MTESKTQEVESLGATGVTLLGEKRMSVRVGNSVNDPSLDVMFPQEILSRGRLATIPDIVNVLLQNQASKPALPMPYITTMSAEYAGLSRTGIPLIVVAHGVGPMATPAQAQAFYDGASNRLAYKERSFWRKILKDSASQDEDVIAWRAYNTRRIQCPVQDPFFQNEFYKLCDGNYGPVEIVEMRAIGRSLRDSFDNRMSFEGAYMNPLMRARLGSRAKELLTCVHDPNERAWDICRVTFTNTTYDSLDRYVDLQRGPVGYLLCLQQSYGESPSTAYLSSGFWKSGYAARFVLINGDGPLTEIKSGDDDIPCGKYSFPMSGIRKE